MEYGVNRRAWLAKCLGGGLCAGVIAWDDGGNITGWGATTDGDSPEDAIDGNKPEVNTEEETGGEVEGRDGKIEPKAEDVVEPRLLLDRKWTLNNGVSIRGKKVRFIMANFKFTRVRGVVKLNGRSLGDYPVEFQKIVRSIISDAQENEIRDNAAVRRWLISNGDSMIPIVSVLIQCEDGKRYPIPFTMLSPEDSDALWPEFEIWAEKEHAERDQKIEDLQKSIEEQQKTKERQEEHEQRMEELALTRRNYALQNELLRRQLWWHIGTPYGPGPYPPGPYPPGPHPGPHPLGPPPGAWSDRPIYRPPIYVIQPAPNPGPKPTPERRESESWGWKNGPDQSWGW